LEKDRGAVLSIRAALSGALDYSEVDLFSHRWWQKWKWVVTALQRQEDIYLFQAHLQYHLAVVSNAGVNQESLSKAQQAARESFYDLQGTLRPWAGVTSGDRHTHEAEQFKAQWKQLTGWDPTDQVALAKYDADLRAAFDAKAQALQRKQQDRQAEMVNVFERQRIVAERRLRQQGR